MLRLIVFGALLSAVVGRAPLYNVDSKSAIPNEYIVVFYSNTTSDVVDKHMMKLQPMLDDSQGEVMQNINMKHFKGYGLRGPKSVVDKIRFFEEVEYIEANQVVKAMQSDCRAQLGAEWGLVRTSERDLNSDGVYPYKVNASGQNVVVYVIDTGIYLENNDFGGRATWGIDTVDDPSPETDENGHGTHVAGTIGGTKYGIAKEVELIAVKVLGRYGQGSFLSVINGVSFVEDHHAKRMTKNAKAKGSIANMSLGGGLSYSLNEAVVSAINSGVPFIVAAGNDYFDDACYYSPASVDEAVTVGCSNIKDEFCYFSNAGKCVDILAPGQDITSAGIGGPYADYTSSGTSMSSPHVAGVAAKYISSLASTPTPKQVKEWLEQNGTINKITKIPPGTANNLLFMGCM